MQCNTEAAALGLAPAVPWCVTAMFLLATLLPFASFHLCLRAPESITLTLPGIGILLKVHGFLQP